MPAASLYTHSYAGVPEVEALAAFLRERASGHVVARADAASFVVLKTFDPPLTALTGLDDQQGGAGTASSSTCLPRPMAICTW